MTPNVLLIDEDHPSTQRFLVALRGHVPELTIELETSIGRACDVLRTTPIACVLLADTLPTENVFRALARLHEEQPALPIVVFAATPSIRNAVRAVRQGATDYLEKEDQPLATIASKLREILAARIVGSDGPPTPGAPLSARLGAVDGAPHDGIVGDTPLMRTVRRTIDDFAPLSHPVLILGETGTGKGLVARALHDASPRARARFADVNCAELADNLFEAEIFGHVRGAYTGAYRDNLGIVRATRGGTIFLDEIGELALPLQAKLLRLLDSGKVRPLGAADSIDTDVRIIAATNRDLRRAVAEGAFRRDLFHRLAVLMIELAPLRKRREDVPLLVAHLLARRTDAGKIPRVSEAAMAQLTTASWPGNVRELDNVLQRGAVRYRGGVIEHVEIDEGFPEGPLQVADASAPPALETLMQRARGDMDAVAQEVGVSRRTVQRWLKKRGLRGRQFVVPKTTTRPGGSEPRSARPARASGTEPRSAGGNVERTGRPGRKARGGIT